MNVSPTEVQQFQRCKRQWALTSANGLGLMPRKPVLVLEFGTTIHEALEAHYAAGKPLLSAYQDRSMELFAKLADNPFFGEVHEEFTKTFADGREILVEYEEWYREEDAYWEVICPEVVFSIPIPGTTHGLRGKIDLLVRDRRSGRVWVVDHKTSKDPYDERVVAYDFQFRAYVWAARPLWPELNVAGIVVNVLRKMVPRDPKENKDGSLSQDKGIFTTPHKYVEALKARGLGTKGYEDHLKWLKEQTSRKFFQRIWEPMSNENIGSFEQVLKTEVMTAGDEWADVLKEPSGLWTVPPTVAWDCLWFCDVKHICDAMNERADVDLMIQSTMSEEKYTGHYDEIDVNMDNAQEWLAAHQKGGAP